MALWRKVFPGNIRDMVLSLSRDGGRTFAPVLPVHADHWQIAACPHRGGVVGMDGSGRLYVSWYTEGAKEEPSLLFTASLDGQRFAPTPGHFDDVYSRPSPHGGGRHRTRRDRMGGRHSSAPTRAVALYH